MMPERILVTGGAGFIGSHTVNLLLREGKQVVVLDNLSSGKLSNLDLQQPNLEFIEGDILEYPLVADLLVNCDAVMHLAAIASVPLSIENPIYTFQVNTQGFLHVLEAIRKAKRAIRLVYASSAAVYGEVKELPCRDDNRLSNQPLSPYALQKLDNEEYGALYSRLYGIPSLALRYFNVYGRGQDAASPYSGVISRFLEKYRHHEEIIVFGNGEQSRDFISVKDVALANGLALQSHYQGTLNIATGQAKTLLNLISCIEAAGDRPARYQFQPAREGDIKCSYASIQLAEEYLGFRYTIPLEEGIKDLSS